MAFNVYVYISNQLQGQFGVSSEKANASADNIIVNYANCAKVPVNTVLQLSPTNIKFCFDNCYAAAHTKYPNDIDKFEKALIECMCKCAKSMTTQQ